MLPQAATLFLQSLDTLCYFKKDIIADFTKTSMDIQVGIANYGDP